SKIEVAGAGYVNLFLDRAAYADKLASLNIPVSGGFRQIRAQVRKSVEKIIVEHTNINPYKAAHIGHLRNAALGDTFVRLLRARGHRVEVQNYIDNTGVQVADVVAGFLELEKKTEEEVARLIQDPNVRFDYYCWDLYARVSRYLGEDPSRLELRSRTLQQIEVGNNVAARMAEIISTAIVRCHPATMSRLNVQYDLLPRESEILHLRFWDQAFELLKTSGAIYLETEGKNKGCWVMRQQETADGAEEAGREDTKVIVRSNGTVTYVGKDLAYQLWKFGLLGKDFYYRLFHTYDDGQAVWMSSAEPDSAQSPSFGNAAEVYNVIDARQSYLQNIVVSGMRALGFEEQARHSIHFSYEMVALSPRCCTEMGIELSPEERQRPYVEVSGRKGQGVKADDLMDRLGEEALHEVRSRHTGESEQFCERIARQIALGALRYFLLKYTCNAVIAFDFRDALSFEGETGPYVQYAVVRARNIFRKLEEEGGQFDSARVTPKVLEQFLSPPEGDPFWELLYQASQLEAVAEQAIVTTEPAAAAKFAFQLAQSFNNFYHRFRILTEQDRERKAFLLWLVQIVDRHLTLTLDLLGIEVPEAM
ncbi:MAG: arginine--tRNA ligase, partial [Acidobacteria bacterium]|nr:arginine--tRNA ligase [Acidobacteriota bacterium]